MEMEMDALGFIDQHLTEGQKREIAVEEWRAMCREACKGNPERIIENIGHAVATKMVAEALGDDANEQIKAKAVDVIADLSVFSVFRKKDVWDREETPAFKVLSEAVKANSDLVNKKVRECIGQLSKREALEIIKSGVIQITPAA
jgi:hypothetical protein